MKALATLFLSLTLFLPNIYAKNLGLDISYAQYMTPSQETYLELYFAIDGRSLAYDKDESELYYGGISATILFKQDSIISAADKFRILTPKEKDTNALASIMIQQERFSLKAGTYHLHITLEDIHTNQSYDITQEVTVKAIPQKAATSDIIFLDSYKAAQAKSPNAKSGYDLIPFVSSSQYYFNSHFNKLSFYTEVYNVNHSLMEDEDYLIRYFIEDANSQKPLNKFASFKRAKAHTITPILSSFNIEKLNTGNYNLVIQIINKRGEMLLEKKQFFYRKNDNGQSLVFDTEGEYDLTGTFVQNINNLDTIISYVKYLYPISTERDQKYQKSLIAEPDLSTLKAYFYTFWQDKNLGNPEGEWREYHHNVKETNQLYGSRIRPGYMSSRGRVFLVYGKPDLIEDRKFEPGLPPYQIWQYNQIQSKYAIAQVNKFFVFADFDRSSNEYELIHSTAAGELNNRRWQMDLGQSSYSSSSIDQNQINDKDQAGSRLNNNMIIKSDGDESPAFTR